MPPLQHALCAALAFLPCLLAVPVEERAGVPTVTISHPQATIVGSPGAGVDSFQGIPFAQPPVGQLRLKPPQPITAPLGTVDATGLPKACPQFYVQADTSSLPTSAAALLLDTPFGQNITDSGEDCLTLNVQRPSTATASSKLPVVFWIYGGGFEFGSTQIYDATQLILNSVLRGQDVMYVSVNYRLGGFGFLPGKEILQDGASNLGLLDQRLGLQWVADNIANFGGDPSKVTIWGESAGSISVNDQMLLYNGNNKYKGKPLFRAAIMDSGSIIPASPVDCPKGQAVYDQVVQNANCSSAADTLECLRGVDYQTYLNAANSVPAILGYNSVALSYLPRPDGTVLIKSPDVLMQEGKYAKVPFIVGDQEDEGTLFSLSQTNISTTADLVSYLHNIFFHEATTKQVQALVATYPDNPSAGSPFGTGPLYNIYPQYKRLAAILGDLTFTLTRRIYLTIQHAVSPKVPTWSYLSSYDNVIPVLGTCHATDVLVVYGATPGIPQMTVQAYYISFFNTMNPNTGSGQANWPQWGQGHELMQFNALSNSLLKDNFRSTSYKQLVKEATSLYI